MRSEDATAYPFRTTKATARLRRALLDPMVALARRREHIGKHRQRQGVGVLRT